MREKVTILSAVDEERNWAAQLMATSDPWLALGISLEQTTKTCHDPEYLLYVAHVKNLTAGMILLDRRGVAGSPYVKSIAVAEAYRSLGIGEELMKFSEDLFRKEAKHMFLCVSSFNKKAQIFYERQGYKMVGEFKNYVLEGADEILMHKRLQ
jgi:[ribosomal protein S18]-alanine N-acetyltransferase